MNALIRIQNALFLSKSTNDDAGNNNNAYPSATECGVSKMRHVGGCVLETYHFPRPHISQDICMNKIPPGKLRQNV